MRQMKSAKKILDDFVREIEKRLPPVEKPWFQFQFSDFLPRTMTKPEWKKVYRWFRTVRKIIAKELEKPKFQIGE